MNGTSELVAVQSSSSSSWVAAARLLRPLYWSQPRGKKAQHRTFLTPCELHSSPGGSPVSSWTTSHPMTSCQVQVALCSRVAERAHGMRRLMPRVPTLCATNGWLLKAKKWRTCTTGTDVPTQRTRSCFARKRSLLRCGHERVLGAAAAAPWYVTSIRIHFVHGSGGVSFAVRLRDGRKDTVTDDFLVVVSVARCVQCG